MARSMNFFSDIDGDDPRDMDLREAFVMKDQCSICYHTWLNEKDPLDRARIMLALFEYRLGEENLCSLCQKVKDDHVSRKGVM